MKRYEVYPNYIGKHASHGVSEGSMYSLKQGLYVNQEAGAAMLMDSLVFNALSHPSPAALPSPCLTLPHLASPRLASTSSQQAIPLLLQPPRPPRIVLRRAPTHVHSFAQPTPGT